MTSAEGHAPVEAGTEPADKPLVDPRAPRVGQAITAVGLLAGIALGRPALVYLIGLVLVTAVVSGWRADAYALLFRTVVAPRLGPTEREPAASHRFARVVGAIGTALASVLLLAGFQTGGYAVAGAIVIVAGIAARTGLCLGCTLYGQVALFRRLDVV